MEDFTSQRRPVNSFIKREGSQYVVVVFTPRAMGLRRCAVERPFGIIQFRISNIRADVGHAFPTTS